MLRDWAIRDSPNIGSLQDRATRDSPNIRNPQEQATWGIPNINNLQHMEPKDQQSTNQSSRRKLRS